MTTARPASGNPPDGGSGSDGPGDLSHLVHHPEQMSKPFSSAFAVPARVSGPCFRR